MPGSFVSGTRRYRGDAITSLGRIKNRTGSEGGIFLSRIMFRTLCIRDVRLLMPVGAIAFQIKSQPFECGDCPGHSLTLVATSVSEWRFVGSLALAATLRESRLE